MKSLYRTLVFAFSLLGTYMGSASVVSGVVAVADPTTLPYGSSAPLLIIVGLFCLVSSFVAFTTTTLEE